MKLNIYFILVIKNEQTGYFPLFQLELAKEIVNRHHLIKLSVKHFSNISIFIIPFLLFHYKKNEHVVYIFPLQ